MKQGINEVTAGDVFVVGVVVIVTVAIITAYKVKDRAVGIRRNVYPDPVCEACGLPLDGRNPVCVPEADH